LYPWTDDEALDHEDVMRGSEPTGRETGWLIANIIHIVGHLFCRAVDGIFVETLA
jgi:hypothetical protein